MRKCNDFKCRQMVDIVRLKQKIREGFEFVSVEQYSSWYNEKKYITVINLSWLCNYFGIIIVLGANSLTFLWKFMISARIFEIYQCYLADFSRISLCIEIIKSQKYFLLLIELTTVISWNIIIRYSHELIE